MLNSSASLVFDSPQGDTSAQFFRLYWTERMLAADVGPLTQLCESDSLPLPLTNQVTLELGETHP